MAEPTKKTDAEPAFEQPEIVKWVRKDRPYCPIHDVAMKQGKNLSGVCFYYCPEPTCKVATKTVLKTIRRFDP